MRFLIRFQLGMLLLAAFALALLFGLSEYAGLAEYLIGPRIRSAWTLRPDWMAVALTPARYQGLRAGLVAVGLAAGVGWLTSWPSSRSQRWPSGRRWLRELGQPVRALAPA